MKKSIIILLTLILTFAMVGCGNNEILNNGLENGSNTDSENVSTEDDTNVEEESNENESVDVEEESNENESVDVEEDSNENEEAIVEEDNSDDQENVDENTDSELTFEEIITAMYEKAELELPMMGYTELTKENMEYMLGVNNFDFIEGTISEPMMGSFAHSVVLFTVEDGADIETIKSDIKNNVDGRKWICVGVEPENIVVENEGNNIILIMSESSEALNEAFMDIMK